jgi:hypothetical protein
MLEHQAQRPASAQVLGASTATAVLVLGQSPRYVGCDAGIKTTVTAAEQVQAPLMGAPVSHRCDDVRDARMAGISRAVPQDAAAAL